MGAGCTKPLDNIVEVRDFGGSFMNTTSQHNSDVVDHQHGVGHRGRSNSINSGGASDGLVGAGGEAEGGNNASPSRNRNHRGAMRVMMHIQEAGNYSSQAAVPTQGDAISPPKSPPPPPSGANADASPRRSRHIMHDGDSYKAPPMAGHGPALPEDVTGPLIMSHPANHHTSVPLSQPTPLVGNAGGGSFDDAGDDEQSESGGRRGIHNKGSVIGGAGIGPGGSTFFAGPAQGITPQTVATQDPCVGQAGSVKEQESLTLILSREVSRRSRRNNLKHLGGFADANAAMRREARHAADHETAAVLYQQEKAMAIARGLGAGSSFPAGDPHETQTVAPSEGRYFADGDDTARTGSTAFTRQSAGTNNSILNTLLHQSPTRSSALMPQAGKCAGHAFEDNHYYTNPSRGGGGSARGDPSANSQGLATVRAMASAPVAAGDRASSAPTRRSERGQRGSEGAVPGPSGRVGIVRRDKGAEPPSANAEGAPRSWHRHHHYKCHIAKRRRLERRWLREAIALYCPQMISGASAFPSADTSNAAVGAPLPGELVAEAMKKTALSHRLGAMQGHAMLMDGEGYNSEVNSEVARRQWRRTRKYHDTVYSGAMRQIESQRADQRGRVRHNLRGDLRNRKGAYRRAVRTFYNQYDSSASCSSYDEYDDQLIVAMGSAGTNTLNNSGGGGVDAKSGLPSYRKPLWADSAGGGVLSAQYDLLARAEHRRQVAADVMRQTQLGGSSNMSMPEEDEGDARLTQQLDTIFPYSIPLRQYTASKVSKAALAQSGGRGNLSQSSQAQPRGGVETPPPEEVCGGSSSSWSSNYSSSDVENNILPTEECRSSPHTTVPSGGTRHRVGGSCLTSTSAGLDEGPQSASGSSSPSDGNDDIPDGLRCDCSSCSCSCGGSSWGLNSAASDAERAEVRGISSNSGGSGNSLPVGPVTGSTLSVYRRLPPPLRTMVDAYVTEKRRGLGGMRRAVGAEGGGGANPGGSRKRGNASVWLSWLRWSVFRRGGAMARPFVGMLAAVKRARIAPLVKPVRRSGERKPAGVSGGGDQTVTSAEAYFSGFFKRRYMPLNLSSRVPFLENYQHRFFRIVSASELHKGIIHPFAVDPPLLMSCAKDLKGEAKDAPPPPTLVTMASVEALIGSASSFVAASRSAAGLGMGDAAASPARLAPTAKSPNANNLINRPVLASAVGGNGVSSAPVHPQIAALNQLLQELKQAHKAAVSKAVAMNVPVQAVPEYQYAYLQDRETLYADIVKTLAHLKHADGALHQQQGAMVGNPLGGMTGLNSASYTLSNSSCSTLQSGGSGHSVFFPSALLTEETERHMNGILFRRYGLLMAGHTRRTVDLHRFVTLIAPAILRYKLVHTNSSFVKEARTLQETKAAERAKQAEAQQQAQRALQQQQEQQRLLLQQQQQMMQGGPGAGGHTYLQINGGGIAALAVGPDNTLLAPTSVPGVLPNSQAIMLMVTNGSNQPPQPLLCYIIIVPPTGLGPTSSAQYMHPQQIMHFQQQLQMQLQQQMMVVQQLQQQGEAISPQQQQQLYYLQQQQQQFALVATAVANQQQQMLSLNVGSNQRQSSSLQQGSSNTPKPPQQASHVGPAPQWQVPSFSTIMEGVKLLPSILYLQSSDVLFGTTRTVRHAVSVPTRACVVTANGRLADCLTRSIAGQLSAAKPEDGAPAMSNMPRWLGQYVSPGTYRTRVVDDDLSAGLRHDTNGHAGPCEGSVLLQAGSLSGSASLVGLDLSASVGAMAQLQMRHMVHGVQLSPQYSTGSLVAPSPCGALAMSGLSNLTTSPRLGAGGSASSSVNSSGNPLNSGLSTSGSFVPVGRVLEGHIVPPHAYTYALRMGEMALRQYARRTHQHSVLASAGGLPPADTGAVDPVTLTSVYCAQQENILAKQLSRMARSNSCEVVSLHPSLLRKKMSGEERRRRRAALAREPLKRAGAGAGRVPQPLQQGQQPGQPIGVGEQVKAKPSSSGVDKPLFSREAISVIVLQQGGSAMQSDPLMIAMQQRFAKSLLKTRHSVKGVGLYSPAFYVDDADALASPVTSDALQVPSAIVLSHHLGSSTAPMMVAAARDGVLSCRSDLEGDAMRSGSANNASEFLAHCIADFTIHNEYMYKYAHVKGSSSSAQQGGGGQPGQPPQSNTHTNPEVEAQRSIAKALLTGVRLGYMRAVEILKLSVEATSDELSYASKRGENLGKGRSSANAMPQTVGGQRYGVTLGRTVASPTVVPGGRSLSQRSRRGAKRRALSNPQPSASSLQLETRLAIMQQQCRYIADRGIYQYGSLHSYGFTDYPCLMLSMLMREGVLSVVTVSNALVSNGGHPIVLPASFNAASGSTSPAPAVSTPRSTLQHAQATAAALSGPAGSNGSLVTFAVPGTLQDSLMPAYYHHPLTSPSSVSDACAMQNTLMFDVQGLLGVCLAMPTGSPPPTAAAQHLGPTMGSPQSPAVTYKSGPTVVGACGTIPGQPMNDTSMARAKFSNHAMLTRAMATLIGPSSPTSSSTVYVRDNKLFCASVGHHTATVLFNISPLAQHVVQNALNIRQQFAKTLAAQLQMIQQVPSPSLSVSVLTSAHSARYGGDEDQQQQHQRNVLPTVINMQPLQAQLRAFMFRGTSLTNLVLGDDIRYRYQSSRAVAAAAYNTQLSSSLPSPTGGSSSPLASSNSVPSSPSMHGRHPHAAGPKGVAPGIPPSLLVDINTYKTQQSVVPAGCCGQLYVPLSSVPDLSLSGRQQRVRSHNKSRQHRSGSTSSMASSTGSLASSLHSSASRQDSSQSDRRGVIGEGTTIGGSSASSTSSAANSRNGDKSSGHSVSLNIPHRSALRYVTDLVTSSRQAASWLGVQLAASTFTNYQTHDCISPNLKLPLPATVPVGPTVSVTTVEVSSVFSQAPVPCAPSPPSFLGCNPPPSTAMHGGALPALRGVPSHGMAPLPSEHSAAVETSPSNSPMKVGGSPAGASAGAPQLIVTMGGGNTVIHRLPQLPELAPGVQQTGGTNNPTLPDPLFANALATVSSVGNLAYTVQTTVHSKSSLSPNYTVLTGSTDTWAVISPEETSMFLSMLCPPDWANHGASTNSFLSVMVAAKVDFGSADVRGPFVYDRRRSYMSHHSSNSAAALHSNANVPAPWVPCALGSVGVIMHQGFLTSNNITIANPNDMSGAEATVMTPPTLTMLPTLPHPSTVTPSSTHYTSYFLSQTYCDVYGPCDYVAAYLASSSIGLRGLLEVMGGGGGGGGRCAISPSQVYAIALQQQQQQQMGRPPVPASSSASNASATAAPIPHAPSKGGAQQQAVNGNTSGSSNYNVSSPDACTVVFEVLSLLDAFSELTAGVAMKGTGESDGGDLLAAPDRLRVHHLLYSTKIILAHGDYYHAPSDGEAGGPDGSSRTENSWYWEELAELEACLSRLCSRVGITHNGQDSNGSSVGAADRPSHVNIDFPSIPPPPPVHVRLYRRFREKQADLLYHQVLKPKIDEHQRAHVERYAGGGGGAEALGANGSTAQGKPSTDPMLHTSPATHGGDDFRNAASIISEVVAEEAAALDRILLHYRLVKDILRRRRANRARALCASGSGLSATERESVANHMVACEQPYESYEFLTRSHAPTVPSAAEGGADGGLRSAAAVGSGAQIPITAGHSSTSTNSSGVGSGGLLGAAAEALVSAHYPSRSSDGGEGASNTTVATNTTFHGITYSQPRHYVAQVMAFK